MHRWNEGLRQLAEECGFKPRVCRPYRAKTKGKVERFNGYLKGSFLVPLAATVNAVGLKLTSELANAHVRRWLVRHISGNAALANCLPRTRAL